MKTLCLLLIALVWIPFASAADSLITYLSFDGSGDSAKDITGNGNDGAFVPIGNTKVVRVAGKFAGAIELDGQNYVDIPWSASIDVADKSFSFELWFKYTEAASNGVLAWGYDMGSGQHAQFWFRTEPGSSRIRGLISDGAPVTSSVRTTEAFNDGEWHHIAVVRDADNKILTLYIDGVELATESGKEVGSITETQTFGIQLGRKSGDADMLKGSLDEFRLWGKALSAAEVEANMAVGAELVTAAVRPSHHLTTTWGDMKN